MEINELKTVENLSATLSIPKQIVAFDLGSKEGADIFMKWFIGWGLGDFKVWLSTEIKPPFDPAIYKNMVGEGKE